MTTVVLVTLGKSTGIKNLSVVKSPLVAFRVVPYEITASGLQEIPDRDQESSVSLNDE